MQRNVFALVLALLFGVPVGARAQPVPGPMPTLSPEMRSKIDAVSAQAKAEGYAALTADHRARVQAIVAKAAAGGLGPREATEQIDALLTPLETKGVMDIAFATSERVRAIFGGPPPMPPPAGGPPEGGPPDGGPPGGGPPGPPPGAHGRPGGRRPPSAGEFFLRVSLTPEQAQALRPGRGAPPSP